MRTNVRFLVLGAGVLALSTAAIVAAATGGPPAATSKETQIARGRYIMTAFACADCHTPKKFGPNGPEFDESRAFSGHPETETLPPAPRSKDDGPWIVKATGGITAWAGPWGTSFTANLTPDAETGLGTWTADTFVKTLRTGRHLGHGRPLLPPMPFELIAKMTDEDLRAVFAYLQSLPPIKNRVPSPLPPPDASSAGSAAPAEAAGIPSPASTPR